MKRLFYLLALGSALGFSTSAQSVLPAMPAQGPSAGPSPATAAPGKIAPQPRNWILKDAGPNSRTWIATNADLPPPSGLAANPAAAMSGAAASRPTTGASAPPVKATARAHRVVSLASGLNYWDTKAQQWSPSVATFRLTQDSFVADKVQHPVEVMADLNVGGAVSIVTSNGITLRSTPVAILLSDQATGNSLVIGAITNCQGVLTASNQVGFASAFCGISADIVYTLKRGSFEQDVIFTAKIDPAQYGFPTNTTRIQILTELYDAPAPRTVRHALAVERDPANRQRMATPDLVDQELHFGSLVFGLGHAYAAASAANTNGSIAVVAKEIMTSAGRTFLVESVPFSAISQGLAALPDRQGGTASMLPRQPAAGASVYAGIPVPPASTKATAKVKPAQGGEQAALAKRPEVVIDYVTVEDSGPMTFQGDTTYLVEGQVDFYDPVVFEGNSVIKYTAANEGGPSLVLHSNLTFNSSMYRPVIFTAVDDSSVGETIGWGDPYTDGPYASPALYIMNGETNISINNAYFRFAAKAVCVDTALTYEASTLTCSHSQFVNCGVACDMEPYWVAGQLVLRNCLLSNVTNALVLSCAFQCVNCTFDAVSVLVTSQPEWCASGQANNCIFANIPSLGECCSFAGSGSNGFYNAVSFGSNPLETDQSPFLSTGGGTHYLDDVTSLGVHWRNAANPNVLPADLLAQLRKLTTYPPSDLGAWSPWSPGGQSYLNPYVPRDASATALGYHFDPLDYLVGDGSISGTSVTVAAGTAIGLNSAGYNGSLALTNSSLTFQGTATLNCWMVQSTVSQEQPWGAPGYPGIILDSSELNACFTKWSLLGGNADQLQACGYSVALSHSEIYGGGILDDGATFSLNNCLLDRVTLSTYGEPCLLGNCTFHGGMFGFGDSTTLVNDSVFDGTAVDISDDYGGTIVSLNNVFDYDTSGDGIEYLYFRGYNNGFVPLLTWESGPLGSYYLPSDSTLINAGSVNAYDAGLYHFTTQTNQTEEGFSQVDSGYHYVALVKGNPVDIGTDSLPPFITTQPSGRAVIVGSNVTFSVSAVGPPTLSYQWRFNGGDISGATGTSLLVTNVQLANAGNYSAVVANPNGSVLSSNAALSVFPVPAQAPAGLISWWPAESNACDVIGTNNGTLTNGGYAAGKVGQAFNLSGADQYVTIPDSASLDQTSLTVEGWLNYGPGPRGDSSRTLFSKPYGSATTDSFAMWITTGATLTLRACVNASTVSGPFLSRSWTATSGWHHVALTFDSATLIAALYLDGVSVASLTNSSSPVFDSHPLLLGADTKNGILTNQDSIERSAPRGLSMAEGVIARSLNAIRG